jgi:hypothetical protein
LAWGRHEHGGCGGKAGHAMQHDHLLFLIFWHLLVECLLSGEKDLELTNYFFSRHLARGCLDFSYLFGRQDHKPQYFVS